MRQVKPIIHFTSIFVLLFFVVSCVRDTLIDPGETAVVVVDCVLLDSSPQTLHLSFGKAPSASAAPELKDAVARLIDLTEGEEAGVFLKGEGNAWTLDYAAIPEHSYRLEVEVPGYEMIWAEQTMPEKIHDRLHATSADLLIGWESYYDRTLSGASVIPIRNMPKNGWIFVLKYNPLTGKREMVEEMCTDYAYVDNFNVTGKVFYPPYGLYDPFDKGEYEYRYKDPYLEGFSLHRRFLRMPRVEIAKEDKPFFLIGGGDMEGKFWWRPYRDPAEDEGIVIYMSVSDEYDKYFCEAQRFVSMYGSSELSMIWQRENVFTNIHNGVGIFGAASVRPILYNCHYFPQRREDLENQ